MISSTFTDLKEHRQALIAALGGHDFHARVMESDAAKLVDVIESSLTMVRDSAAYIGVISKRYGQIPKSPKQNPENLSITELEFNEAVRLGRPVLLFIMGKDHLVHEDHIETNAKSKKKLNAFRERAKQISPESAVHRVYAEFNSLAEFKEKIGPSLAELERHLNHQQRDDVTPPAPTVDGCNPIPQPPTFYAEPDYIGSHNFVGRDSQLQDLSDWAKPADPTNLLLFEAIGGNGKSMLTWEWTNNHAPQVREWAGRFWYSFYERGAIMADFCQRALAYMTGQPLGELRKKKTAELREPLLTQLHAKPWLLILDGLERVLVAYHRIDAAEVPDEEVNIPTDKIVNRNPCDAIRDEDNDLLRALAAAAPSKILVSSRLTPRVLLNPAHQPIVGVRRINLPGLRPADAEKLLRSCGVTGDSAVIQDYLAKNCDNHPLVIGVLAGLINDYLPDRGNFDRWSGDPAWGGQLNLAELDLIQRRNHILRAALEALPEKSSQLLSTLALLSESVDSETLSAFNPHLPPEPDEVTKPELPEEYRRWNRLSDDEKTDRIKQYEADLSQWNIYEEAVQARLTSPEYRAAPKKLTETVSELERRGLLQFDSRTKRYDLHPVVRGVAAGGMKADDKERYGQRVVDHFSSQPHNPYEDAETLDDLRAGLHVVRTLLKLGHFQEAVDTYQGGLAGALFANLEAYAQELSLLRPFFPSGWGKLPEEIAVSDAFYLANCAACSLDYVDEHHAALDTYSAALSVTPFEITSNVTSVLHNLTRNLIDQNRLADAIRIGAMAHNLATAQCDSEDVFVCWLHVFADYSRVGQWSKAEVAWQNCTSLGYEWSRNVYRPGRAEYEFARSQFWQGRLQESHLLVAEQLVVAGKNRIDIRNLHKLRASWRLERSEWTLAAANFQEAVRMARESGLTDGAAETGLALAKFHLGQVAELRPEAERLAELRNPAHRTLAQLWLALGDTELAKYHALAAYRWAWANGEPYVHRYELTKTTELLQLMNVSIPDLPPYDPAKDEKFPWEADVEAAIAKLRAENKAEKQGDETAESSD